MLEAICPEKCKTLQPGFVSSQGPAMATRLKWYANLVSNIMRILTRKAITNSIELTGKAFQMIISQG